MHTFTPKQYLEIDIATNFGLDKNTWDERLAWFHDNRWDIECETIERLKKDFLTKAKDPALVLAGIMAYRDMLNDQPIGYPIGLDATASGLQLLSVLVCCPLSAALCNVIDSGRCVDAYTEVYVKAKANGLVNQNIDRKSCKQALMTHLFGSKAVPKEVFGEGSDLGVFYETLNQMLPGANELNHALLSLWNPKTLAHEWTLPDGFDVRVKVMSEVTTPFQFLGQTMEVKHKINAPQESSLSLAANIIHSLDGMVVREMVRRCSYDRGQLNEVTTHLQRNGGTRTDRKKDLELLRLLDLWDFSGFLSARIIEVIDFDNVGHLDTSTKRQAVEELIQSLPKMPFDLLTIHDCFRCHPNYGNDLRQQYINIMAEIAGSDMLSMIAEQITGKPMPVTKFSPNMAQQVRNAEYMLC